MLYQGEHTETVTAPEDMECLNRTLQSLRDQLRHTQRLASVGTMACMVLHELNNILTPIVNYAQLARKNPRLTDKAIESAVTGGQRAADICQLILGLSQQDDGEIRPFSVREMIDETVSTMACAPKRDGIDFINNVPKDMVLAVRRIELQQVMLNLLLNARQAVLARPGPRRIELSSRLGPRHLLLRVRDNGVGISRENIKQIFEPFFTTRKSATGGSSQGSGLGLAICREILQSMNGDVSVKSTEGAGTTFTLHLPR